MQLGTLQKFAASTLFPSQQQITAHEPEDLMGEATADDWDVVPVENLVGDLVQDRDHLVCSDEDEYE